MKISITQLYLVICSDLTSISQTVNTSSDFIMSQCQSKWYSQNKSMRYVLLPPFLHMIKMRNRDGQKLVCVYTTHNYWRAIKLCHHISFTRFLCDFWQVFLYLLVLVIYTKINKQKKRIKLAFLIFPQTKASPLYERKMSCGQILLGNTDIHLSEILSASQH